MARPLELRHLRYFIAVAEELNFTRAAEHVFLTQPALSQQIKSLEEIVGVPLFDRTGRAVRLTEAGQVFLAGARRTLREAERGVWEARRAGTTPRLALGYIEYAFQSIVTPLLQTLLQQHPGLRIERREVPYDDIPQALEDGLIDVGVGILPMSAPRISVRQIAEGRWQLLLPASHPLAERSVIYLSDLAEEPLLMFSRSMNPVLYDLVLSRFRRAGVEPQLVYEIAQVETGQDMVELGVGLWVVATFIIQGHLRQNMVARDLAELGMIQLGLAWRTADTSPGVQGLLGAAWSRGES